MIKDNSGSEIVSSRPYALDSDMRRYLDKIDLAKTVDSNEHAVICRANFQRCSKIISMSRILIKFRFTCYRGDYQGTSGNFIKIRVTKIVSIHHHATDFADIFIPS
jgi:hypothetical protein